MLICGVKVSHDGGIAVFDGDRLLFSHETEKIANGHRYSPLGDLDRVAELLRREGIDPAEVGQFVLDGWWDEAGTGAPSIRTAIGGRPHVVPVAPYVEHGRGSSPLDRYESATPGLRGPGPTAYSSYHHATGHLVTAYATSPFARRGEDSLVLVWDGGITPRLYHVTADGPRVRAVGPLLSSVGNLFPHTCGVLEPFHRPAAVIGADEAQQRGHLEIAGKAMAYAALGTARPEAFGVLDDLLTEHPAVTDRACVELSEKLLAGREELLPGLTDADIIATLQDYLGRRLLDSLAAVVERRFPGERPNLCLGGGCALNIKWNSLIRASGRFREVWVPPFPNDAGAAIGAAASELFVRHGVTALEWDVFAGPLLQDEPPGPPWSSRPAGPADVAAILRAGEPVVVLDGRAELGPRALGARSILAPATSAEMKTRLNEMKQRAWYRPVAPICLRSRAAEVFDPGTEDPYMLFEHRVRPGWAERIPAVLHLDGTARLQTVDDASDAFTVAVLREYDRLTGIPVLCNTSANLAGHGFFPDAATAAGWGGAAHVWAAGRLWSDAQRQTA